MDKQNENHTSLDGVKITANSQVKITIIGVIGTIIVALITTFFANKSNNKELHEKISSVSTKIQAGVEGFNPGSMDTLSSNKSMTFQINFSEPFNVQPKVVLGLSGFDISNTSNSRILVYANRIDKTGFKLIIEKWGETKLYWAQVNWVAFQN